jgi:hypothetical protein
VLIGESVGADPDGAVNADVQGDLQRVIEDVGGATSNPAIAQADSRQASFWSGQPVYDSAR